MPSKKWLAIGWAAEYVACLHTMSVRLQLTPRWRHRLDQFRRRLEERTDQAVALFLHRFRGPAPVPSFDGIPRLAIVTVNYSTTHWLKLMLLTLSDQNALHRVSDIVIVDNDSRDEANALRRALHGRVPNMHWVDNQRFLSHARGIRKGLAELDRRKSSANVVLAIDTDVIFLRPDALSALLAAFEAGAALAGEMRHGIYGVPEAQASFVAFRRDVYARRDILPWVNHGAPSYWMQRSIRRAGLAVADFRSNEHGSALHRGRAGVQSAGRFYPNSSYASVSNDNAHFMGIPGGEATWKAVEERWSTWLEPGAEERVTDKLRQRFSPEMPSQVIGQP